MKASEFYREDVLSAFWDWTANKCIQGDEFVYIALPLQEGWYRLQNQKREENGTVAFLICERGKSSSLDIKLDTHALHPLFTSASIEIWENKKRHANQTALPLRFGLSVEEKGELLRFIRSEMNATLTGTPTPGFQFRHVHPERQKESATVDVALWIDGRMRGSIICHGATLLEAVRSASREALRDVRMKPVGLEELDRARIEVSLLSDLRIPLTPFEKRSYFIDGRYGYSVRKGNKGWWYLPTVFNEVALRGMPHLISTMVKNKAKLDESDPLLLPVVSFSVDSAIEDEKRFPLCLDGPVAVQQLVPSGMDDMKKRAGMAADWLLRMQDEDGYMPVFADPLTNRFGRMDWPRLSGAAYALAVFGMAVQEDRIFSAARKTLRYILSALPRVKGLSKTAQVLTLVYCAKAALALKEADADILVKNVLKESDRVPYEPIFWANLASLLALQKGDEACIQKSIAVSERVFQDFQKQKANADLARFPELVHVFHLLHAATGQDAYAQKKEEVEQWLVKHQSPSGGFPAYPGLYFPYTRGTGKIFEVLALSKGKYEKEVAAAYRWLCRMQYDAHNLYFVPSRFRECFYGGFRHDYVKTEAWIDAASHFIRGVSRLV